MVEISHLTKTYGKKKAVDDISFTMEPGHIYGLLGPNGAGKSTTMNMMTGYIAATSGTVTIDGYDIFKKPREAKSRIGYLPEIPPLYPDMTVREYLRFAVELKNIPKAKREKELERVLAAASLESEENRMIRNLSKGFRQRVGFAQSIIGNPELIILDEPTVGLDPRQLAEFRELILQLKNDHIILLSSHILAEVSEVCDHIFIISGGKLILSDDAENLSSRFEEKRHLLIHGIGDGEFVRMYLLDDPDIKNVTVQQTPGEKEASLDVEFTGKKDIRPQVSQLLMEQHFAITEMQETGASLEDVFLKLTETPDPADADAAESTETDPNEKTEETPESETTLIDTTSLENIKEDNISENEKTEAAGKDGEEQ